MDLSERLHALIAAGRMPPLVLLADAHIALQVAQSLLHTKAEHHPDLHFYRPEGKTGMHSIASMRQLCDEVALPPHEAPVKVFIVTEAERMLETSANALLKTFEEPTERTHFILLTHHPERIAPTLLSRAQTFSSAGEHYKPNERLNALLSSGITREALTSLCATFEEEKKQWEKELDAGAVALRSQEVAFSYLQTVLGWFRDREFIALGVTHALYNPQELIARLPYIPFQKVEKQVGLTRLGFERSIKLETCLTALFTKLQLLN